MIRSALLLCATVLVSLCFACMPAYAPMQVGSSAPPSLIATAFCIPGNADSFANAVQMARPFPLLTTDTPVAEGAVAANMRADLKAAYQMAPPFFQWQLCALDGVFVSKDSDSWGFRNYNDGRHYIAITQDLWNGNAPAMPYGAFENGMLKTLLRGWTGPAHPPGAPNPTDSARTVLAALAHEYGHVLWYDTYVPVRGGPAYFDNFCSDGTSNFYTGPLGSWATPITDEPPSPTGPPLSRWRFVGDIASTHKPGDVDMHDLLTSVPPPGAPDNHGAGQKLRRLYASPVSGIGTGRWAGLFAAFSPQEDFVETFKLFVLRKAASPLQSLPISIPIAGGPPAKEDVPGSCLSRRALKRKLGCFQASLCGDPAADPCGFTCTPKP